jgi:hypothetical protein
VGTVIAAIFKYKREHGNTGVPEVDPQTSTSLELLTQRLIPSKLSSKVMEILNLPCLFFSLSKLGLIELTTAFKLVEAPTKPKAPGRKKAKAATAAPLNAKEPIAAIVFLPKALPKKKKSVRVYSTPIHSSTRRTKALLQFTTHHEETSFHSILKNSFKKQHTSWPSQILPLSSSIEAYGALSPNVTTIIVEGASTRTADVAIDARAPSPNVIDVAGEGAPMTTADVAVDVTL